MTSYQQKQQKVEQLLSGLHYKDNALVKIQIFQLLNQMHSLRPLVDNYVFNDGSMQRLFKLQGTIPIVYRKATYNIPLAIWLPISFPNNCPICYVTPVAGMKIKPKHMHVDAQGLIYHPYLHSWKPGGNSTLADIVGRLCSVFGKNPPVFASKSSSNQSVSRNAQQSVIQKSQSSYVQMNHVQSQPKPQQSTKAQMSSNRSKVEEELRKHLQRIYDQENAQLNSLASAQKQLETHSQQISTVKQQLGKEKSSLLERRQILQIKIQQIEAWLSVNDSDVSLDLDQVLLPCDTWSEQCILAAADDASITDVILELDRLLDDRTIQLNDYFRLLRRLAREQFMAKALAKQVYLRQNQAVRENQSMNQNQGRF